MSAPGPGWAIRWAVLLLLCSAWLALGTRFVGRLWTVAGPSMQPTLEQGDRVIVDRWTFRHRAPRVGEVVVLLVPGQLGAAAVKRVTAVDTSGQTLEVLGDNRDLSLDSRSFGRVPRDQVLGRVVWRLR